MYGDCNVVDHLALRNVFSQTFFIMCVVEKFFFYLDSANFTVDLTNHKLPPTHANNGIIKTNVVLLLSYSNETLIRTSW